jgi:sarcosine oxidase
VKWDVIVIGVGGMGSAVVYHVSARGRTVLGLEQSNIPNDLGSSHGINRIIRMAYAEDPCYVPLLRRAYQLWRELGRTAHERLLYVTGGVDIGHYESWIIQGSMAACKAHKLKHEVLSAAQVRKRFPGFQLPKDLVAVYQSDAGFVLSERSIVAHVSAALRLGAEVHARERVLRWDVSNRGVTVLTDRGSYEGRKLVITAGPWSGKLVRELDGRVKPERQVLLWVQPKKPRLFEVGVCPVFYMQDEADRYYGLPIHGIPGFKIGKYHHLKEEVDPDDMDRECHPGDEDVLRRAIRKYFPEADGPIIAMKTCLFSNTEDEHFILDLHPEYPQVSIAAGFSGHGFKFCSVVGEIMADFALDGGSKHFDLDLFRLRRLFDDRVPPPSPP